MQSCNCEAPVTKKMSRQKVKKRPMTQLYIGSKPNSPLPIIHVPNVLTRSASSLLDEIKMPVRKNSGESKLQPFKHTMTAEEQKESHLISALASNNKIPVPLVKPIPEKSYIKLYPAVFDKMPPQLITDGWNWRDNKRKNVSITKKKDDVADVDATKPSKPVAKGMHVVLKRLDLKDIALEKLRLSNSSSNIVPREHAHE